MSLITCLNVLISLAKHGEIKTLSSMKDADYDLILVESFIPNDLRGMHGIVHIRPLENQGLFDPKLLVECSKELSTKYEVGTIFKIRAKITSRQGGKPFIYSRYSWPYEVVKRP